MHIHNPAIHCASVAPLCAAEIFQEAWGPVEAQLGSCGAPTQSRKWSAGSCVCQVLPFDSPSQIVTYGLGSSTWRGGLAKLIGGSRSARSLTYMPFLRLLYPVSDTQGSLLKVRWAYNDENGFVPLFSTVLKGENGLFLSTMCLAPRECQRAPRRGQDLRDVWLDVLDRGGSRTHRTNRR